MKKAHTPAKSASAESTAKEGRRLTNEEWRYLQHRVGMLRREGVGMCAFMLFGCIGLGLLAWWFSPEKEVYFLGFFSLFLFAGVVAFALTELPKLTRIELDRERLVRIRQIRIFPLPLVWFQPQKGCKARLENAEVTPHWSRFFEHLRPIDGDGSFDIEAHIYETSWTNYVLSFSNGLSIEREMPEGLMRTLAMRHTRRFTWAFFVLLSAAFALFMLSTALGIFPVAESFGAFLTEAKWLLAGAIAFLVALSIPALYFWRRHKQALARIEAMYVAEGLPERGHERNVGSQIDSPANSNAASSHDDRNAASTKRSTT